MSFLSALSLPLMTSNFTQLDGQPSQPMLKAASGCDTFQGIRRSQKVIHKAGIFGGACKPAPFVRKFNDVFAVVFFRAHASKHDTLGFPDVKKNWVTITSFCNFISRIGKIGGFHALG